MAGQVASPSDSISVHIPPVDAEISENRSMAAESVCPSPSHTTNVGTPSGVEISGSQDTTAESACPSLPHGTINSEVEISEDARKEWQTALSKENCQAALDLLNKCPRLAWQGWKEDPIAPTEGLRTALLVGARRGCPELVKKMLELFPKEDDLMQGAEFPLTVRGLRDLLVAKDPHYELDAMDMAVFHGNREIVFHLANASFDCKPSNPYGIQKRIDAWQEDTNLNQEAMKGRIRHITKEVMAMVQLKQHKGLTWSEDETWLQQKYKDDYNFNFLPWEEYLFSFACGKIASSSKAVSMVRDEIFRKVRDDTSYSMKISREGQFKSLSDIFDDEMDPHNVFIPLGMTDTSTRKRRLAWTICKDVLWKDNTHKSEEVNGLLDFLLQIKDGLGRTAVHVAVEAGNGGFFLKYLHDVDKNWANGVLDGVGRTALHWAAALDDKEFLRLYLEKGHDLRSIALELGATFDMLVPCMKLEWEWLLSRYGPVGEKYIKTLSRVKEKKDIETNHISPLRLAIIHKHVDCVDAIVNDSRIKGRPANIFDFRWDHWGMTTDWHKYRKWHRYRTFNQFSDKIYRMGPLEVATIARSARMVDLLLKDGRAGDDYRSRMLSLLQVWWKVIVYLFVRTFYKLSKCVEFENNLVRRFWILLQFILLLFGIIFVVGIGLLLSLVMTVVYHLFWVPAVKQEVHSALHIASGCGNFDLVKIFLDQGHQSCDLFRKDKDGNTALHHVMLGMNADYYGHQIFELKTQFLENVNLEQFLETQKREQKKDSSKQNEVLSQEKKDSLELAFIERQGCIELLLQAGFDPWAINKNNESPHPRQGAPSWFLSWWYDKLTKETIAAQSTLNAAANAISVTAALVATASYVGPLQPPLSYREYPPNSNIMEIHMENPLVRIFITCNTLSFFFAVAAIMMAMIPSIPIPRQSARIELQRTRRIVKIAVFLLFPSIMFVLVAFATASIVVIPKDQRAWKYGGLSMTSSAIGGFLSLCVIILFSLRILVVLDIVPLVRKFYDGLGI